MQDHDSGTDVLAPNSALEEQPLSVDLERAAIDMQIATAHKYPRSIDVVIKRIRTMATYNEDAAANCVYSLPRGGKPIIGPSIGFANVVATAWGNCIDGSRWVATDRKEKVVIAEGVFHDYETNRKTIITEQRRIVDKHGRLFSDDMIIVTSKAAGAIARRNAILQIVPRALWHPIWEDAFRIVRGDQTTFAEHKEKALRAFAQFGVKPEQIFMWLGVRGEDDLTLEHIPLMRGGYAALRDGSSTVEEMFDPRRMTAKGGFEAVSNPLADDLEEDDDSVPERAAPGRATAAPATARPSAAPAPQADNDDGAPFDIDDDENPALRQSQSTAASTNAPASADTTTAPKRRGRPPRAAAQEAQEEGRAEQGQSTGPAPKPAQDAPAEAQPLDPRSTEQYVDYWRTVMAAATNATALEERWKSPRERALRGNCSVIEDDLVSLRTEQNARLAQLRGES